MDGQTLPAHPFDAEAPEISENVPLPIGTTITETSIFFPAAFDMTWESMEMTLPALLPPGLPLDAKTLLGKARGFMPDATPAQVFFALTTEGLIRSKSARQAELASRRPAPVYVWLLEWVTPVDGGKWGSPHGLTVPLIMDTVERVPSMFGPDLSEPLDLSAKMSGAWAEFARTGVPSAPGLPTWPAYESVERQTMVFNAESRVESDPLRELRQLFQSNPIESWGPVSE